MRRPRLHRVDRALIAGQATAVLATGAGCGWTAWLASSSAVLAAAAGAGAAAVTVGGMLCARGAGARGARQELVEYGAEMIRLRDEQVPWTPHDAGDVPAGPPVPRASTEGTGKAAAVRRIVDQHGDGAVVVAEPAGAAVGMPLVIGPDDPRWLLAVRSIVVALDAEMRPEDLRGMEGRGVFELAELVGRCSPELDKETVIALVGDYVMRRAGQVPTSGRDWRGALDAPVPVTSRDDPRWSGAVCRLAEILVDVIRPGDGNTLGGRGVMQLVDLVAPGVPDLDVGVVRAYVGDYINVRAGGREHGDWRGALAGLSGLKRAELLVDLVAATGDHGLALVDLVDRVERVGASDDDGTAWVLPVATTLVDRHRLTKGSGRYRAPVVDHCDPRWVVVVRRLAGVLAGEIRPEDGNLAGRGVSVLAGAVAAQIPSVSEAVVRAFVRDYMEARAGYRPTSGYSWREALTYLPPTTLARLVVDMIAAKGAAGLSGEAVGERLGWLGAYTFDALDEVLVDLIASGVLVRGGEGYRRVDQPARSDG